MTGIRKETIKFVDNAKKYFELESGKINGATYINSEMGYIGLRMGFLNDCIEVYELGEKVGRFDQWIDRVSDEEYLDYYIKRLQTKNYSLNEMHLEKLQQIIDNRKERLKEN